jgi:hypothetical protein
VKELRRALHVGEEKRDDTRGKTCIHETIMVSTAHRVQVSSSYALPRGASAPEVA